MSWIGSLIDYLVYERRGRGPCRNCGSPTPLPYGVPRDDVRHPVRCAPCTADRQQAIDSHDWAGFIAAMDGLIVHIKQNRR